VHKARLNLSPVKGALTWATGDKTCRRCNGPDETLAHVLGLCPAHKADILARHEEVLKLLIERLPRAATFRKEQRHGDVVPDLVVTRPGEPTLIVDVKVSTDLHQRFVSNQEDVTQKYEPLRQLLSKPSLRASVVTLQLGLFCTAGPGAFACLRKCGLNHGFAKATLRKMAAVCCHSARNTVTHHLTGVLQTF
jgi:hypothetical protein